MRSYAIGFIAALVACTDGSVVPLNETGGTARNTTSCDAAIAGGTYENVNVPPGSNCTLENVTVNGNVTALEGARLVVRDSRVTGNIQGDKAALLHVVGGTIGGNIQIADGDSPGEDGVSISGGTVLTQGSIQVTKMRTGRILITDAILEKGNVQVEENEVTGGLEVRRNRVAQNLEVRKHSTTAAKVVSDNVVGQKLECRENAAPFAAAANSAGEDACRALN